MTDMNINEVTEVATSRRKLFRKSAEVAVTAPAVALLLSAASKRAHAASPYLVDAGQPNSISDAADAANPLVAGSGSDEPTPPFDDIPVYNNYDVV